MTGSPDLQLDWLHRLKRKIVFGVLAILAFTLAVTVFFLAYMLRDNLMHEDNLKTKELGHAIHTTLRSLMLARNQELIQDTVEQVGNSNNSIVKAFVINKQGRIAYSSDTDEIGRLIDRTSDDTCVGCHTTQGASPSHSSIIIRNGGSEIQRHVTVIYNEPDCYGCHSLEDRINGKLIIDRSLEHTQSLIRSVEILVMGGGLFCLLILTPFLSRMLSSGLNKYIEQIISQNVELRLLYVMMERLSKTIDFDELKNIVFDVVHEVLDADEIDLVFHKNYRVTNKEYRIYNWKKATAAIQRKKLDEGDPLHSVAEEWMRGSLDAERVIEDGKLIFMPIQKSDLDLALLIVRKERSPFDVSRIRLLKVIRDHISVAFENAHLYHMAITDELTSLFTQRHFRTCMDRKIYEFDKYGEKFALLILDLDNFKRVNDEHGHLIGDAVLSDVSNIILQSIRENDLAFRYGGEEFTTILPSTEGRGALHVAERIRSNIESFVFEKGTLDLRITISIGISLCPDNASSFRDLVLLADKALYKAKQSGKNRVIEADA